MSIATSTMAQVNKCTRSDKSSLTIHSKSSINSKRQLPKSLVLDYILGKTELLHLTIKNNLIALGTHHIELHMKAHAKAHQKKKLTDDEEFIPCSVQIEFAFK
eukprot:5325062-Ditylum_brightwellii.AAC.1